MLWELCLPSPGTIPCLSLSILALPSPPCLAWTPLSLPGLSLPVPHLQGPSFSTHTSHARVEWVMPGMAWPCSCPCFPKTSQVLASPGAFLSRGCSSKVQHWHELSTFLCQPWLGTGLDMVAPQETHGDGQLLTGTKESLSGSIALSLQQQL